MKNLTSWGLLLFLGGYLFSCSQSPKTENQETLAADTTKQQVCSYDLLKDSARIAWTAYKFTEKIGVNGKFDAFMFEGNTATQNPQQLLESLKLQVLVSSINSANAERDAKIKKEFFGTMTTSDTLSGYIKEIGTDSLSIAFKMNGIEKDIRAAYKVSETEISVISNINISLWNASPSLAALNKVCKDLHKGTDGKSVLHPEVLLSLSVPINKVCQ